MMKSKRVPMSPKNYVRSGICAAQQTAGAAALLLNGADASGGSATFSYPYSVDFYSAGNLSGRTFTLTGLDQWGNAQTETVTGPNNTTVASTKYYSKVTAVSVDGAVGTDVEVGASAALAYALAVDGRENVAAIAVDISGTINYDMQKCYERLTAGETPNWVAGGLTGQTSDGSTAYTSPVYGVRLKVNSYSNGATIAFSYLPGRSHGQ